MRTWFATAAVLAAGSARADLGHYTPGGPNIRDYFLPDEGLFFAVYNYWYDANSIADDAFTLTPVLAWVTPWKLGGARVALGVAPALGVVEEGSFGAGDVFVEPLWLDWEMAHVGLSAGYGFYAPVGRYAPGANDNLGSGFWTHQIQVAAAIYPWANRRLAIVGAITYEISQAVSVNWGISQYVMLANDMRLELGGTGYGAWTADASVHAIGGQLGIAYVPWQLEATALYFYEVAARDRARGQSIGVSIAKKI